MNTKKGQSLTVHGRNLDTVQTVNLNCVEIKCGPHIGAVQKRVKSRRETAGHVAVENKLITLGQDEIPNDILACRGHEGVSA